MCILVCDHLTIKQNVICTFNTSKKVNVYCANLNALHVTLSKFIGNGEYEYDSNVIKSPTTPPNNIVQNSRSALYRLFHTTYSQPGQGQTKQPFSSTPCLSSRLDLHSTIITLITPHFYRKSKSPMASISKLSASNLAHSPSTFNSSSRSSQHPMCSVDLRKKIAAFGIPLSSSKLTWRNSQPIRASLV